MSLAHRILGGAVWIFACALLAQARPLSVAAADNCYGCHSSFGPEGPTASGDGWIIALLLQKTDGSCIPAPEGGPWPCAAVACVGTATITVQGPPDTSYAIGYQASPNGQHYALVPAPKTDANGSDVQTVSKRAPCGGGVLFDASGPNGEAWVWGTVDCDLCAGFGGSGQ